jgi:glycyl-tRNA synthetase beta chain
MAQFVLEIGVEEMPARFAPGLLNDLGRLMAQALLEARIDYARLATLGTPRRLAVLASDMAETQRLEEEVVTGPPVKVARAEDGSWTKAGLGFARSQGVSARDMYIVETDKGDYLAVRKSTGGGSSSELLAGICPRVISGLPFPKKMRWGSGSYGFGRPIRWILCKLDARTIAFELAGIRSGDQTHGHRVMGPGPHQVAEAADYPWILEHRAMVVADPGQRRQTIQSRGDELARKAQGSVVWDEGLLDEVVHLVEYPKPLLGNIDPGFLELPREVLLTCIATHQKSFGIQDANGRLKPHFLTVCNLEPADLDLVRTGWERVLKARLEDARFYWKSDLAHDFDTWLAKLDNVTFLAALGSMGDKSRRIEKVCGWLAQMLAPEKMLDLSQAGLLAKCDLVSEMVGEFDDLQGIMGAIYARKKGYAPGVADAIGEQYLPAGPDSPVPATLEGGLLSIADRMDTLTGCFGLDMRPTGAADPYGLRRAALGIIRTISEHELRLDLGELIVRAVREYDPDRLKVSADIILAELRDFFSSRLKAHFTARGFETLVAEACLGAGIDDIWALEKRLEALDSFSRTPGYEQAVLTFKRAANIIRKQGQDAGDLDGAYDVSLFTEDQEKSLAEAVSEIRPRFEALMAAHDYPALLRLLEDLRPAVDDFFDHVMVMEKDPVVRRNRLNLLQALVAMLGRIADFNALQI